MKELNGEGEMKEVIEREREKKREREREREKVSPRNNPSMFYLFTNIFCFFSPTKTLK